MIITKLKNITKNIATKLEDITTGDVITIISVILLLCILSLSLLCKIIHN
jgi:hypothetical protein